MNRNHTRNALVSSVIALLLWLCTVSLVGNTSAPSIYGGF